MHYVKTVFLISCFAVFTAGCKLELPAAVESIAEPETQKVLSDPQDLFLSELLELTSNSDKKINVDLGYLAATKAAVLRDPQVMSAQAELNTRQASLRESMSLKDFNFSGTILGGVEDVTDEIAGVAAILSANRVVYDGGAIDARIEADQFGIEAAKHALLATMNERATRLSHAWIEYERYQSLANMIEERLSILNPLLKQLDQVASAGIGDMSQVASAQRTVFAIQAEQKTILEAFEQSKLEFISQFGSVPKKSRYQAVRVSKAMPRLASSRIAEKAPALLSRYYAYKAAEATIAAVKAQNNITVGFEAKLQRPFADSKYDSDETFGLVLNKKFYRGDQLSSKIEQAEARAAATAEEVRRTYREGEQMIKSARQMIKTMETSVKLAQQNAEVARSEVKYLRKQLVIGGSTLESVLSAEARLYEAESKEVGFLADWRKAEATVLGTTGGFSKLLGFSSDNIK